MVRVRIFYPTDPAGTIAGGIETFIRGILKAAPDDIEFSMVGLTTDAEARPVGRWSACGIEGRAVPFFPVGHHRNPRGRSRVPLLVRLMMGIARHYRACTSDCDVLEFHRLEPALMFLQDARPKNAFIHQNMADALASSQSDVRWKSAPWLYFAIERVAIRSVDSLFGVRADAVEAYRGKYPELADRFRFIPTWVDPDVFFPVTDSARELLRASLVPSLGIRADQRVVISVGRLDTQKNPLLLIDGFALLAQERPDVKLIVVGDGVLRGEVEERIARYRLADRVSLTGLRSYGEIADLLRVADCFALTSAYEGMPMSVLEALGSGVPVVTTRVGEVERVVRHGETGEVLARATPEELKRGLQRCLSYGASSRRACLAAVSDLVPRKVLQPVYEQYRRWGRTRLAGA